jgi:CHAD domain-containing protein
LLRRLLDQHVSAVQAADGALQPDLASGVHRMRVSLRRLRSTLSSFRPLLDGSVDGLRTELAWISTELGGMRDADMVRERVRTALGTQQQSDTEPFELLEPFLTSAHRDGLARAQEAWHSERYAELSTSLSRLFGSQVVIHPPGEGPAKDVLPDLVGAELAGVAKFSRQVARAPESEELDAVMHRLRLATKRARYITVALRHIDVRPVGKLERDLKRLHSLLGERHDSTVTRRFLARLLETEQLDVPLALIERHIARETALTSALDQKVPPAARKVTRWRASLSH